MTTSLSLALTGILLMFLAISMKFSFIFFLADEFTDDGDTDRDDFDEFVDIEVDECGEDGEAKCLLKAGNFASLLVLGLLTLTTVVGFCFKGEVSFSLSL
jgi:hypothetical protein